MEPFLGVIGFFGMIGCGVAAVKKHRKKQDMKKEVITLLVCLIMFIIAMSMSGSNETDEVTSPTSAPTNTHTPTPTEKPTPEPTEAPKEKSFNEKFMDNYVAQGLAIVVKEYCEVYDEYGIDVQKELFYRNHQGDTNIPVLEEVVFQGEGLIIGTGTNYSDKGTTMVDIYLGTYEFDYTKGIAIAQEELLAKYPEEKYNFISIVSGDYMNVERGDKVTFSGTLQGIRESSFSVDISLRGTCEKKQ